MVREAQQKSRSGDELREAMREQRAALGKLTSLVEPALQRRVHDTLQAAAMSDPQALSEGRLLEELVPAGFDALLAQHRAAWLNLWRTDIVIEGDARAQTAVHSDLYYLLATSTPDTHWPMGACGLTPGYTGHAFWDSDTWIFPALLLLHPERAKSLVMFRSFTLPAAQARAQAVGL